MTAAAQASWIALVLMGVTALAAPYAVGAARKRLAHAPTPVRLYAPHLVFLCTVRFAPMLSGGMPTASGVALAFLEAFVIWALGVATSEWFVERRLRRGTRERPWHR